MGAASSQIQGGGLCKQETVNTLRRHSIMAGRC